MSEDQINAFFEICGAYVIWMSVVKLIKDKEIKGVYWPAWVFYTIWGLWNLYYYPVLGQWYSVIAGFILTCGNIAWVYLAVRLEYKKGGYNT